MSERVHRSVDLVTVPLDLGAGRRGTDMGPSAIRIAGLTPRLEALGLAVRDHGHVPVAAPETRPTGDASLRFGRTILHACRRLGDRVGTMLERGGVPLVLGGDHSIAMGTLAGVSGHFAREGRRVGLLWIDAHADCNTPETSPSGNVHGMPLAVILGRHAPLFGELRVELPMVDVERTVLMGVRDVDAGEREQLKSWGLKVVTMKEIDERGIRACMVDALARVTEGTAGFHLSFDMDALDPEVAPGVGTPVPGGLTYREAHLACELVAESGSLVSMEVVEVNPVLDVANRTARLAVELILSAMGKRIV